MLCIIILPRQLVQKITTKKKKKKKKKKKAFIYFGWNIVDQPKKKKSYGASHNAKKAQEKAGKHFFKNLHT